MDDYNNKEVVKWEETEITYKIEPNLSRRTVRRMIKNFVINGLGISKQWVESLIIPRIDLAINKRLDDLFKSRWFDSLLQRSLFEMMKNGVAGSIYYDHGDRMPLEKYVKQTVASEIRNMIFQKYDVSVQLKEVDITEEKKPKTKKK